MQIVILSYNHPEITARCVLSARSFYRSEDILLVHNGSEKVFCQELRERFPDIEHLELKKNKGFSGGANAGLIRGFQKSDWVLFLTNDTQIKVPTYSPPAIPGLYAPRIWRRQTDKMDSWGGYFKPFIGKLWHATLFKRKVSRSFFYVPGTAFLLHREPFYDLRGFDETLGTYWEDVDFSVRAQLRSHPVEQEETLEIRHAVGKTCHKNSLYTTYYFHRNRRWVSWRYTRGYVKGILFMILAKDFLVRFARMIPQQRFSDMKLLFQAYLG